MNDEGLLVADFHQTLERGAAGVFDFARTAGVAIDIDVHKKTLGGRCVLIVTKQRNLIFDRA